jgi:capsular polysaccharide transport system ATP-binding protein
MIELQNLTKSYRLSNGERRYIFRDLNFSFPEGTNIGLIGRNGAGKSTLLRLIGGIDTPDRGKIVTDKRISWPVGLSGGLQGSLTGRDGVKFVCRIYGMTREEMLEKVRFVQDFAEIGEYFDQPVKSYSSGMRARLNFGLSWAFDFDYYLMDEVGAVGDARFKEKSRQLMEARIGQSNVILVSHAMPEIARLCNVVVLVNDGQAILFEDVHEGIRAYQEMAGVPQPQRTQQGAGKGPMRSSGPVAPTAKAPSSQSRQDTQI